MAASLGAQSKAESFPNPRETLPQEARDRLELLPGLESECQIKISELIKDLLSDSSSLCVHARTYMPEDVWRAKGVKKLKVIPLEGGLCFLSARMGEFRHLTHLFLSDHCLMNLPQSLTTLPLQHLDVSKNMLRCLPENFSNLTTLRTLNITDNKELRLPGDFFCRLEDLRTQADWGRLIRPLVELYNELNKKHETEGISSHAKTLLESLDPSVKSLMYFLYPRCFPENLNDLSSIQAHLLDSADVALRVTYKTFETLAQRWENYSL